MHETGTSSDELTDTGLFCTLNKTQSITIPIIIRDTLSITAGDEVIIGLTSNSKELFIQSLIGQTLENIMIISNKGSIRIPEELMRTLYLKKGEVFHIYIY
jgi:bifunctional DNA-binding transcriptional regulator/antitoxin component of YhaV-PrlF toxin-antitoxin module